MLTPTATIADHLLDGRVRMVCNRGITCSTRPDATPASTDQATPPAEPDQGYDSDISESNIKFITGEYRPKVSIHEKKPVRRSYRPLKDTEETCPFKFMVYWSKEHQRWYLPKKQGGETKHCGHFQRDPEECKLMARHAGLDTLHLVEKCFNACLRPAQIKELIQLLEGKSLDTKTILDYQSKLRDAGVFEDAMVSLLCK